jgi:hypothetical protein
VFKQQPPAAKQQTGQHNSRWQTAEHTKVKVGVSPVLLANRLAAARGSRKSSAAD